jgi:hypothetical protein
MIPFIESLIEPWLRKTHPRVDDWFIKRGNALKKNLGAIGLICLFIGCYRAWVFEHKNAEAAMYGKDGKSEVWARYNQCAADLKQKQAEVDGWSGRFGDQIPRIEGLQQTVNSLQGTLAQQQGAVTTCVGDLAKAIIPEPPKVTFLLRTIDSFPADVHEAQAVLLTNKTVTPVDLTFGCEGEIESVTPTIMTQANSILIGGSQEVKDKHSTHIEITSPAWTPTNPLVITVKYRGESVGRCGTSKVF